MALSMACASDVQSDSALEHTSDNNLHAAAHTILLNHCTECHGHDVQESHLRLDSREAILRGGEFGPAAVSGKANVSELIRRVSTTNDHHMMPPEGPRLSDESILSLESWINAGMPWPGRETADSPNTYDTRLDHWAWQPLRKPPVPQPIKAFESLSGVEKERNPIDFFIRKKLIEQSLAPSPAATRATLVRRLSFDLLGLPPTPEQVIAFTKTDDPQAYATLVEQFLNSPRYGERWARHWLDVVHYGDTHGYDKDKPRHNAWPYRDYVIHALNNDTPYARFMEEQIAGDVLFPDTTEGFTATGFIAAGPWDFIGHTEVPETKTDGKIARHLDRDDMVATVIGTFCSVTIHCAQCHNHKFDPISQDDYYSLQSVFAALDREDRSYHHDPQIRKTYASLSEQKLKLAATQKKLESDLSKAAGPDLASLDEAIKPRTKQTGKNDTAAFGYHSALSPHADSPKWVQLDLGHVIDIHSVTLRPCYDDFNNIGAGFGFPQRYRIEVSNDPSFNSEVTRIADNTTTDSPNPGLQAQHFQADTKGRYIRITATKLAKRNDDYMFALAEVQVHAGDELNPAKHATVTSRDSIETPPRWQKANLIDGHFPSLDDDLIVLRKQREELLKSKHCHPIISSINEIKRQLEAIEKERRALPAMQKVYSVTARKRQGIPRTIHVLSRGNVLAPTHAVSPGTLSLLQSLPSRFNLPEQHGEGERRIALAHWLSHPENPLPWRSIVNRVWQHHFGKGIVSTPGDFGRMGDEPTHPDLLDWLANNLRDNGGSLKSLHRLIVNSATYRQTSLGNTNAGSLDSENNYLWRQNRRKLEAEAVRDAVLSVAGTLDLTMGGPGWKDFKIEQPTHSPHYRYDLADPTDTTTWRRSIYRFIVRSQTQPFMTALDCADPSMRVQKRNRSISALQALALLNNGFMTTQAEKFAQRIQQEGGHNHRSQIDRAIQLAIGRHATSYEHEVLGGLADEHGLANACRTILNLNEFLFVD